MPGENDPLYEKVATPPDTGALPMGELPILNVTVPVAVDGVMVAVNVVGESLHWVGLGVTFRAVALDAWFTTSLTVFDVLPL